MSKFYVNFTFIFFKDGIKKKKKGKKNPNPKSHITSRAAKLKDKSGSAPGAQNPVFKERLSYAPRSQTTEEPPSTGPQPFLDITCLVLTAQ